MSFVYLFCRVQLDEVNPRAETITESLTLKKITADELKHNYTCTAKNRLGSVSRQALVKETGDHNNRQ